LSIDSVSHTVYRKVHASRKLSVQEIVTIRYGIMGAFVCIQQKPSDIILNKIDAGSFVFITEDTLNM